MILGTLVATIINKMQNKLIIMRGLPASGKSTKAKELVTSKKSNTIRLNKDLLRTMLHCDKWSGKNEEITTAAQGILAQFFLEKGMNVIIDDTNLNPGVFEKWKGFWPEVEVVDLTRVNMYDCILRDSGRRPGEVGKEVIINMARRYGLYPRHRKDVICDIDGTLCDISDRLHLVKSNAKKDWLAFFRNIPFDKPRKEIIERVQELSKTYNVVLVSGRPEDYKAQTIEWLKTYGVPYETLIMRRSGDFRPDDIVKKEILDAYFDKSQIELVIDDRPRVIRMWQAEGLRVEDVGKGVEF